MHAHAHSRPGARPTSPHDARAQSSRRPLSAPLLSGKQPLVSSELAQPLRSESALIFDAQRFRGPSDEPRTCAGVALKARWEGETCSVGKKGRNNGEMPRGVPS